MEKNICFILAVVFCLNVWAQKIELSGTVTGLPEGTKLVVAEAVGSKLVARDTLTPASNGK